MVRLSHFLGEMVYDIANARSYADNGSAALSEQYYADPFIRNIPVPHYIIEDAEIDVPVMVVGLAAQEEERLQFQKKVSEAIKNALPPVLLRTYKYHYIHEREKQQEDQKKDKDAKQAFREEAGSANAKSETKTETVEIPEDLLSAFAQSAQDVSAAMDKSMTQYLSVYNYALVKLLDLSDEFSSQIYKAIKADVKNYAKGFAPFLSEEEMTKGARYVGNFMFFEFKKLMSDHSGVQVEVNTSNMNEYGGKDCMMHIKLKIREQDLSLVVEEKNGKTARYLALS